jgi:hypothetical protein
MMTTTTASHSLTQSVEMMMMDPSTPPRTASSVDEMLMATARLLDGALGDMVAVSTQHTAA